MHGALGCGHWPGPTSIRFPLVFCPWSLPLFEPEQKPSSCFSFQLSQVRDDGAADAKGRTHLDSLVLLTPSWTCLVPRLFSPKQSLLMTNSKKQPTGVLSWEVQKANLGLMHRGGCEPLL